MVQISGKPFSQLTNLNVTGEFRVKGTVLGERLIDAESSAASQLPTALNTPVQIEFGQSQDNDFFSLNNLGTITCKRDGYYLIDANFRVGRNSNPGTAFFFIRFTVNDIQTRKSLATALTDTVIRLPLEFIFVQQLSAGDEVKFEMYRDGTGVNNGGLFEKTSQIGWLDAPTASLSIFNFE